jgi:hypothetical protein
VRCDAVERELSARLDGAVERRLDHTLASHLAACPRCRAFQADTSRLRDLVRIEVAGTVPDLVPRIMAEVRREAVVRRLPVRPIRLRRPAAWGRYAAAFVAGAVAAALVAGGLPGMRRGPDPALATEIPGRIARAANLVTSYRAGFHIVELGFHPSVDRRVFDAEIAFRAPERFRAVVTDRTEYPSSAWPRNDLTLAVDADRWLLDAPRTCPRQALPGCAFPGRDVTLIHGREPFDGEAHLPTDIVLPVGTLAGTDRVRVVGDAEVLGRDAVVVELAYRDATPLFGFLQAGGSWRPFYPHDRVLVSLDSETWFPLAYEVRAVDSPVRSLWSARNALPAERPGQLLFRADARSLGPGPAASWRPRPETAASPRDHGFRTIAAEALQTQAGYRPLIPSDLRGLRPYRSGMPSSSSRPSDEVVLSFTRGLSWLVLRETRSWTEPALFGGLGALAQPVHLSGGGIAYYEPATGMDGRRLAMHARGWAVALESNLPRRELVRIAASLPLRGHAVGWLDQTPVSRAVGSAPYVLLPRRLPAGYRPWTAQVGRDYVTVYFRRAGAELDGIGIRLHQERGVPLPPPVDPEVLAVQVRGVEGRYSPARGELEWVEDGVYRSVGGTALDLPGLLDLARSLAAR